MDRTIFSGATLRDARRQAGISLLAMSQRTNYSKPHLGNVETGKRAPTLQIVEAYDRETGNAGLLIDLFMAEKVTPTNRRQFLAASGIATASSALPVSNRVVQALDVILGRDADTLAVALDSLDELVAHYTEVLPTSRPADIHDELLDVRSYANSLLRHANSTRYYTDFVSATGWLSNLLAVVTSYLGDHGAALLWCSDAERQGEEAKHPELAGWATLNRATIAYYKGKAARSSELAQQGQQLTAAGSTVNAKLAAQEMRATAMLGDAYGMARARVNAARKLAQLPADTATSGAFSIALAEEQPYTATSLLHVGDFAEAARVTRDLIKTAYPASVADQGARSTNYARTQLILGLAESGLGHVGEAVAAGHVALGGAEVVWPTLVIAKKLDRALMRDHGAAPEVMEYHERCAGVAQAIAGSTSKLNVPEVEGS